DAEHLAALLRHLDDAARADRVRGDVDALAVHLEVTVTHHLARLVAGVGEAHAEDHVVQAELQLHEQVGAGLALHAVRAVVVPAELALEEPEHALDLLLLTQLHAVAAELHAALAMLTGRIRDRKSVV